MHCSRLKIHTQGNICHKIFDFINGNHQVNEPRQKRLKSCILSQPETLQEYLTVAKVDVDIISETSASSTLLSQSPEPRQVLLSLKALEGEQSSMYQICIATLDGVSLACTDLPPSVDSQTLEVLKIVVKLSNSRRSSNAKAHSSIKISSTVRSGSYSYHVQLCARILLHDSRDLVEDLPGNRFILDFCFPQVFPCDWDSWAPRDFYDSVFMPDKTSESLEQSEIDQLDFQLYPFQKRAVRWLLQREGFHMKDQPMWHKNSFRLGFIQVLDAEGTNCYVSHLLGIATTNSDLARATDSNLRGGILAEEMGLGKTVEMIALICLHQERQTLKLVDQSWAHLRHTPATLIITPPSILQQWKEELQRHSPRLKVMAYTGLHRQADANGYGQLMEKFCSHHVVLTTYNTLAAEIHYAPAPSRDLRYEKKYERKLSPVTQIIWWRVVLDEAQMIESGLNNAARMAQLIPRQNAWAMSGTPVRKDSKDLLGLLVFLRYQPYNHSSKLWDYLVAYRRDIFKQMFGEIALRHTKEQIKDDIQLPPQKRIVITIPFTQIEEQHYSTLYQQMCDDCGLDADGCPVAVSWDPNCSTTVENMRNWLTRLRQTCLHPEVGIHNRRALGNSRGPLRTVREVLEVMTEQNDLARRTEERALLLSRIRRGQILEHAGRSQDALDIWLDTLGESKIIVEDCRMVLKSQLDDLGVEEAPGTESEGLIATRTGVLRQRLRAALEVEHICTFFVASAYYQIKTNVELSSPGSAAFLKLEKAEEDTYERAKELRKEILSETHKKAELLMGTISEKAANQSFVAIPSIESKDELRGIESRSIVLKSSELLVLLEDQASHLDEWRERLIKLLLLPLVDEEDTSLKGDEYEASTKQQDELYVYMNILRAVVGDRHETLTGQTSLLVDYEMNLALDQANRGEGYSPALMQELLRIRAKFRLIDKTASLRGVVTQLRDLKTTLRSQVERGNTRAAAEVVMINIVLQNLNTISIEQTKVVTHLSRELELFKDTMNSRLEYYRQLQQISDSVAPYDVDFSGEALATTLSNMQEAEEKFQTHIKTINARGRYLLHLRDDANVTNSHRLCIICQQPFEIGVLTSCGHSYCVECLRLWWGAHRNCPTCKKHLSRSDFHQITYKPQELIMEEEIQKTGTGGQITSEPDMMTIYSGINDYILNQIKNTEVDGSFGTKIDTLARHMLWIREHDPGAKSIIFSQFKDFLDVLAKAFSQFKIGFTGIDRKDGIQKFKENPSLECFFLHAKAHSSGLNLTNATHVFLCEPLINTAIELQAIARVHRIGQHQSTTVWMYLVENTVEKSIYEISVARRMSHIKPVNAPDTQDIHEPSALESKIEAANSFELQQASLSMLLTKGSGGGELVAKDDLWNCLFRRKVVSSNQNLTNSSQEDSLGPVATATRDR